MKQKIYRCEILMPESLSEGSMYLDHTVRTDLHPLIQPLTIRQTAPERKNKSDAVYMLSRFSCVQLLATLWTAACQAPLSMGFSRQEY